MNPDGIDARDAVKGFRHRCLYMLLLHSVYLLFLLIARSITQTCPPGRQGRDYTSHHTLRTPTPGWREDDYKSYPMSHPINSHLEPPNCFDIKPIEYISSPWIPTRDIPPRPRDFTSSSTRWRSRKPTVILPDWSNFSLDASTCPLRERNLSARWSIPYLRDDLFIPDWGTDWDLDGSPFRPDDNALDTASATNPSSVSTYITTLSAHTPDDQSIYLGYLYSLYSCELETNYGFDQQIRPTRDTSSVLLPCCLHRPKTFQPAFVDLATCLRSTLAARLQLTNL